MDELSRWLDEMSLTVPQESGQNVDNDSDDDDNNDDSNVDSDEYSNGESL